MKGRALMVAVSMAVALVVVTVSVAQWRRGRPRDLSRQSDRGGVPTWESDKQFKHDVFTFVRVRYGSGYGRGWRRGGDWRTDWPDSDLNFSYRLQELTSLEVDPNGKILQLTDDEIFDYPFLYIVEPGDLMFAEDEVRALRRYLTRGGFLMVDDFWGEHEWQNFYYQIRRVFPDRPPEELSLEHEFFHCVYDLQEKPQIPSINHYWHGMTTERWDAEEPHYWAIYDDKGRVMVIICHNTDLGDGWEREGMDPGYFREYSEKWAYPLGINIVTYAMTH